MNVEEARAQYYDGSNLNAGIIYVKALEAEVERLQKLAQQTNRQWRDDHVDLLARAEKAEAELAKWTRKHDDADLQALSEQHESGPSHGAAQAYINGLKQHLRQTEAYIQELAEGLKAIQDRDCKHCYGADLAKSLLED